MRWFVALAALGMGLMGAWAGEADALSSKKPIVFIWAKGEASMRALGSGFVLGPSGDVLTAKHVVEQHVEGEQLVVTISTKASFPVPVFMNDIDCANTQDFCFLRILPDIIDERNLTDFYLLGCYIPEPEADLLVATFFAADNLNTGVVTPGGKVIGTPIEGGLLPTSVPMEAGMSGGPVFHEGVVIGLVKGGTAGGKLGFIQPLQRARSSLLDRGYDCLNAPADVISAPAPQVEASGGGVAIGGNVIGSRIKTGLTSIRPSLPGINSDLPDTPGH